MKRIIIRCPAKINLFLKILNKRRDNFHNIQTIFEKISLFDTITIKEIPRKDSISITTNEKTLPIDRNNLCFRAAKAIKNKFNIKTGLQIHIDKNIPISAGLGGGSSDAAGVLQGLKLLWTIGLENKNLEHIAVQLGSDVALFTSRYSFILGEGRGDKIFEFKQLEGVKLWHVLICPYLRISSKFAYSLYDRYTNLPNKYIKAINKQPKLKLTTKDYDVNIITYSLSKRDAFLLDCYSYNDFSYPIFDKFRQISSIRQRVEKVAGRFAHLSGSGSTLFTVHREGKEAQSLVRVLQKKVNGCRFFVVSTYQNKEV